jgi:hypothetical protein
VFRYPETAPAVGSSDGYRLGNMVCCHSGLQRVHALESCSRVVAGRVLADQTLWLARNLRSATLTACEQTLWTDSVSRLCEQTDGAD